MAAAASTRSCVLGLSSGCVAMTSSPVEGGRISPGVAPSSNGGGTLSNFVPLSEGGGDGETLVDWLVMELTSSVLLLCESLLSTA